MTIKPETIRKHIEAWARKKAMYDRHQAGETYAAIGHDLGISGQVVREHVTRWRVTLEDYPRYLQERETWPFRSRFRHDRHYIPLIAAGLIGKKEDRPTAPSLNVGESMMRSPVYGYA
jgi:hypothetical protein